MRNHRGNMLLTELTIVLLFFAIVQAIVLQVFAKAHLMNRDAEILNNALLRAEDITETLAVSPSAEAALLALGFLLKDGTYKPAGMLTQVELTAWQGDKKLFTIPALRYQGGSGT